METPSDFRELLASLNAHSVDYLIVGGYALAYHGAPRVTGDLDILVRPDRENAQRVLDALSDFGFSSLGLGVDDFQIHDRVVQLGVPPLRVDIMTSLTGVSWEEAWAERVNGVYGDIAVFYIGLEQFVRNKKALGRKRDQADLEALGRG